MKSRGTGTMGRVVAELTIANNEDVFRARAGLLSPKQIRQVRLQGIVDSGATRLVLPKSIVVQLGLPSAGKTKVRYADNRIVTRPLVWNVWLRLQGRESIFSAIVEPVRKDVLIGAIVMEELDFVVNCTTQTLEPRDPKQIASEVE